MQHVTAADFTKRSGKYRDVALREPVLVTHHDRDTLVLVTADEYRRPKAFDTLYNAALQSLPGLLQKIPEEDATSPDP